MYRDVYGLPHAVVSLSSLNALKTIARRQLPGVKHAHVLESLAAALGENNWAALNAKLSERVHDMDAVLLFMFSYNDLCARLYDFGYRDLNSTDLDFSSVTEIFRRPDQTQTLRDMVVRGTLTEQHRDQLVRMVEERQSMLIIGMLGSGKTTLMLAILNEMATRAPSEQFALYRDAEEGSGFPANVRTVERHPNVSKHDESSVPTFKRERVAIDEIRDGIGVRAIDAWNRMGGGLGTLTAYSIESCLDRLVLALGVGATRADGNELQPYLRESIDAVIHVDRKATARIKEIATRADLARYGW